MPQEERIAQIIAYLDEVVGIPYQLVGLFYRLDVRTFLDLNERLICNLLINLLIKPATHPRHHTYLNSNASTHSLTGRKCQHILHNSIFLILIINLSICLLYIFIRWHNSCFGTSGIKGMFYKSITLIT